MKIFLVGATGRSGKWLLKTALDGGHQVTALVRGSADRIAPSHPSLTIVVGDLLGFDGLDGRLAGHDAIISSLNSATVDVGTQVLITAAECAGVSRFLGIAGGGILQLDETRLRRERPGYPAVFVKSSEGHLQAWRALEASSLAWTLCCTPDLVNAPASGRLLMREEYMPDGGNSVALGDVAAFVIATADSGRHLRKRVGLTAGL